MNIDELLQLDCREEMNVQILIAELKKIKPFANVEKKLTVKNLENFYNKFARKYPLMIHSFKPSTLQDEILWYSVSIWHKETKEIVKVTYGMTIFEAYAKSILFMWYYVKEGAQ